MAHRKDYTGQLFGQLTALEFHKSERGLVYWKFVCKCGSIVIRRPSATRGRIHNACNECKRNKGSVGWKGVGELPYEVFNNIKRSAKTRKLPFSVTVTYLWNLYKSQDGKCALTNWPIEFNKTSRALKTKTASLDRIDSTKGYIKGNLQWVHRDVNKLKKNIPNDKFIQICKAVTHHYKNV